MGLMFRLLLLFFIIAVFAGSGGGMLEWGFLLGYWTCAHYSSGV